MSRCNIMPPRMSLIGQKRGFDDAPGTSAHVRPLPKMMRRLNVEKGSSRLETGTPDTEHFLDLLDHFTQGAG
jgi:hypothetical protein